MNSRVTILDLPASRMSGAVSLVAGQIKSKAVKAKGFKKPRFAAWIWSMTATD